MIFLEGYSDKNVSIAVGQRLFPTGGQWKEFTERTEFPTGVSVAECAFTQTYFTEHNSNDLWLLLNHKNLEDKDYYLSQYGFIKFNM